MKKLIGVVAVLAGLTLALGGCAAPASNPTPTVDAAKACAQFNLAIDALDVTSKASSSQAADAIRAAAQHAPEDVKLDMNTYADAISGKTSALSEKAKAASQRLTKHW